MDRLLLLLIILFLFFPSPALALHSDASVSISASIGVSRITIDGYSSPLTRIELTSTNVYAVTYSDSTGYFQFDRTLLPQNPSDLCLNAVDDNTRRSFPVCIPPPPAGTRTHIGPIILPPTISLNDVHIKPRSQAYASGQTLPQSDILIYLYQVAPNAPAFPKTVEAFSLPPFHLKSDADGNFSFNLPTAYASDYRLFAAVKYQDQSSPKSNTLIYKLPSLAWLFWQQNSWLITTLSAFVLTLTFFFYLLYIYFLSPPRRYLPALRRYLPALPLILVVNKHPNSLQNVYNESSVQN